MKMPGAYYSCLFIVGLGAAATICINTHDGCIIIVRETTRAQSGKLPGKFSIYANGNFFSPEKLVMHKGFNLLSKEG